jgi:hypothetical protein
MPTPPPAAVPALLPNGRAAIAGSVVSTGDSPQPVARAIVTVTSVATGAAASVVTDEQGAWEMERLAAGEYHVTATKSAYLSMAWRAKRPGRPGTAVVVSDAGRVDGIHIGLPRGAVIAGRLTLPTGQPLADTEVRAIPLGAGAPAQPSTPSRVFHSDDQGNFRIFGLMPGRYLVAAYPAVGRGEFEMGNADDFDRIAAEVAKGMAIPRAQQSAGSNAVIPPRPVATYAPSYHPGVPVANFSTPIVVAAGDERLGVDIAVSPVRATEVLGVVLDMNGRPTPAVQLDITAAGPALPSSAAFAIRTLRPNQDGAFTFSNVPPGNYRVTARAGGVSQIGSTGLSIDSARNTQWAQVDVRVDGEPISNLVLQLREGERLAGRLRAADGEAPPDSWLGASVVVKAVATAGAGDATSAQRLSSQNEQRSATVDADGTFVVTGLVPGLHEASVILRNAVTGWHVVAITHDGRDLRDAPLTFEGGSMLDVDIVLSRRTTMLSGRFSTETGAPVIDYTLVVFPEDRALWHAHSPRIVSTRPSAEGRFTIVGLPPGAYRLAAVDDVLEEELKTSSWLESIHDAAVRITMTAGQETRQDLRVR